MAVLTLTQPSLRAQNPEKIIAEDKASGIIGFLASDSLKGRGNKSPNLLKAGIFIANHFLEMGLQPLPAMQGFYLPFFPSGQKKRSKIDSSLLKIPLNGTPGFNKEIEYNIVGVLPGKSKPGEFILFSSHYDHEGLIKNKKDSVMNGANDNASGTTALLLLAEYYTRRADNERTLVFCAFAGEELGLKGSQALAEMINPTDIIAGINLEMLGIPQYLEKKIFITGVNESTLGIHLWNQLKNAGLKLEDEPDPDDRKLFYRSDNYSFAKKGVPYHTIMASDDSEPCYHKPCDELERINISNLVAITNAIAIACRQLVSGEYTPSRINISKLQSSAPW